MKLISNADVRIANEVLAWAETFLMEPNPQMKRLPSSTGEAICPFAKTAMAGNFLYLTFHHEINGMSEELIESTVLEYREPFKKVRPYHEKERLKKALLIIFPEIPPDQTNVLDIVHDNIKTQFVREGLMVTQCHARCDGRSVHNQALKVYLSPYPLIALRHMAIHDILFVEENEDWFGAYDQRFGARFKEPDKLEDYEKPLVGVYTRAKARFVR